MNELTEELKKEFQNYNQEQLNLAFVEACINGNLKIIEYLLNSPDLTEHADIHVENNEGFQLASNNGHLDIVRYLLTSPDLKEHTDIHADHDLGFQWACENKNLNVVEYLLSFDGEQCIDFQRTDYNLDWAIEEQYNVVIIAMMKNLKNNNPLEYLECLSIIDAYNKELYEQVKNIEVEGLEINSSAPELFL